MKLQDQVCPRHQAGKLKQLGIQGESYFLHGSRGEIVEGWTIEGGEDNFIPAWTAAELAAMLPDYKSTLGNLEIGKCETDHVTDRPLARGWYNASYWVWGNKSRIEVYIPEQQTRHLHQGPTLAITLAELLIYLLESKFITAEEVNARLKQSEK